MQSKKLISSSARSGFSATGGIRGGRIKERAGLHDPAITGRVDWDLFAAGNQSLRVGVSGMYSGLDNTNKGGTNDLNGHLQLLSADYDYRLGDLDFRGVIAHGYISEAEAIGPDIASEIFGWYQDVAWHWLPEQWMGGRYDLTDSTVFARYEVVDTQYEMPHDVARDPAGIREIWTVGAQCWLTENLVLKFDYQMREDETADDIPDQINVGFGYRF